MPGLFATVVFGVSAVGVIGAVAGVLLNRRPWDRYASDHLMFESEHPPPAPSRPQADLVERDEELRQMLEARNARRRRRGEAEIDIDREIVRLTAPIPPADAELRAEVREMVIARNHRRARGGQAPLDVDAEVRRQIEKRSHPIK